MDIVAEFTGNHCYAAVCGAIDAMVAGRAYVLTPPSFFEDSDYPRGLEGQGFNITRMHFQA